MLRVYLQVHCLAGAHRAGTAGCVLLMRFGQLDREVRGRACLAKSPSHHQLAPASKHAGILGSYRPPLRVHALDLAALALAWGGICTTLILIPL